MYYIYYYVFIYLYTYIHILYIYLYIIYMYLVDKIQDIYDFTIKSLTSSFNIPFLRRFFALKAVTSHLNVSEDVTM